MPTSLSDLIIPNNPLPLTDNQKLIINTFGLGNVKTLIYQNRIGKDVAYTIEDIKRSDFENNKEIKGSNPTSFDYTSKFFDNVPIFDEFTFSGDPKKTATQGQEVGQSYIDVADNNVVKTTIPFHFQTCLITVSMTKNIVQTLVQGRKGTIKEYIADGDLQINVKGVLTAKNREVPEDDIKALMSNLTANTTLNVTNKVLNNYFNCTAVVVTDFTHPQQIGSLSSWQFEFNCLSDYPVELFLSR